VDRVSLKLHSKLRLLFFGSHTAAQHSPPGKNTLGDDVPLRYAPGMITPAVSPHSLPVIQL
ncbi:MAG TPA: hypothetical protein VFQ23_22080, partial [Anaerolineales bacterium]|nr:hypothetical protein [Anaerolineales bacterium]